MMHMGLEEKLQASLTLELQPHCPEETLHKNVDGLWSGPDMAENSKLYAPNRFSKSYLVTLLPQLSWLTIK